MAKFEMELPEELMNDFYKLYDNAPKMFEEMTQAGAQVVYKNVLSNMKHSFSNTANLESHLKITKPYRTYGGTVVNTKVAFYGYYRKNDKDYVNRKHQKATAKFDYKTGKGHNSSRVGGRKEATYEYVQKGVPVPLIIAAREYGTSSGEQKKPFFRKSFTKGTIEQAMREAQKKASGGLIDE